MQSAMPCHGNWEWNLLLSQDENFAFSQNAALREVQCIILHGGGGGQEDYKEEALFYRGLHYKEVTLMA